MSELGYGSEALKYWAKGWYGILPVPSRQKMPVPSGFTGYEGKYPDKEQVLRWADNGPGSNLALRVPRTVVGIDVDAYGAKKGRETLEHAESLWGKLPGTVRTTSRADDVSGIRMYSVPAGTVLHTVITFPELGLDGIETVQYFHRYAMAWPSVHPTTGGIYRWMNDEGIILSDPPSVNSFPLLPDTWLDALSRPPEEDITTRANVDAELSELDYGTPSKVVQDELNKAIADVLGATGGRHDEILKAQGRLLRRHEQEEPGVGTALNQLHDVFVTAVTSDGSRSADMAESEWYRALTGNRIHDKIASTPSRNKALEAVMGGKAPSLEAVMQARQELRQDFQEEHEHSFSPETPTDQDQLFDDGMAAIMGWDTAPDEAEDEDYFDGGMDLIMGTEGRSARAAKTSWGFEDLSDVLESGDFEPEEATVGRREDGVHLFYAAKVNALVGPPESAKSWVAQYVASQELLKGNHVAYLDFEDSKKAVVGRMTYLGAEVGRIKEGFLYASPKGALAPESKAELFGNLDRYRPSLIVVDGLGAVMALHNHEMKDNTEFIKFFQLLLEPLTSTGAAVVIIDHVSKDADESGSYAIGAQAKLQMITGVQIKVTAVQKFGRGKEGKLRLSINKDRPGGVRMNSDFREFKSKASGKKFELDYWATVYVDAREQPNVRMVMRFDTQEESDAPTNEGERHSIRDLMVEFLEKNGPKQSTNKVCQGVTGRESLIKEELELLKLNGFVAMEKGPRNANLWTLVKKPLTDMELQEENVNTIMGERK